MRFARATARRDFAPPQAAPPVMRRPARASAIATPPLASLSAIPAVMRKCAGCEEEKNKVQPRLAVGPAGDRHEREADSIAAQVMFMPGPGSRSVSSTNGSVQARAADSGLGETIAASDAELTQGGSALPTGTRGFFESRMGRDLSDVRVHSGPAASAHNTAIQARAFTYKNHVWLGSNERAEPSFTMAHELAHVMQQTAPGVVGPQRVMRAEIKVGDMDVHVDYSNLVGLPKEALTQELMKMAQAFVGMPPSVAEEAAMRAMTKSEQTWLLLALKLHVDNATALFASATAKSVKLDTASAFTRLLEHTRDALFQPLQDKDNKFEFEALRVSGLLESALASKSDVITTETETKIGAITNPQGTSVPPLDAAVLEKRLPAALRFFLKFTDPIKRKKTGSDLIGSLKSLGDLIFEEARSFFAPFVELARTSLLALRHPWKPSEHIVATQSMGSNADDRLGLMLNRAQIVGNAITTNDRINEANIFRDAHFDPKREADMKVLLAILKRLDREADLRQTVTRLDKNTGFQDGEGETTRIGLSVQFDADKRTACQARWRSIDTLTHEVLHALAHPDFEAKAEAIGFPLLVREGFTESLGNQLYNERVRPKAIKEPAFKASLEAGLADAPCPGDPDVGTVDYGQAGLGAETIRGLAGDKTMRAAYFLGRPELVGIK